MSSRAALVEPGASRSGSTVVPPYDGPRKDVCRELLEAIGDVGVPTVDRRHDIGGLICGEDEQGSALCVVLEGVAKLSVTRSGAREAILHLAGPWEPVGVPLLGRSLPRPARAEAFTACRVVKVPRVFVERAVRERSEVALKLAELLALEISRREELFECLLARTTEARLARLLPILTRDFGEASDGGWIISLRMTHYDLAAMVASTRESVTAAMNALRRRGVLEKKAGTVTILKPEELAKISDSWNGSGFS